MIDIDVLRAAGLSDAQVVAVFAAEKIADAEKAAEKREKNRQRMRVVRAVQCTECTTTKEPEKAKEINGHVHGVQRTECTENTTSFLLTSSVDSFLTQTQGISEERSRGRRLSPDWTPNESHRERGRALGLSDAQIGDMAQDMRLWAEANANRPIARKADWNKTFDGWMRRNKPNGHTNGGKQPNGLARALHKLGEHIREQDDQSGRGKTRSEKNPRLL